MDSIIKLQIDSFQFFNLKNRQIKNKLPLQRLLAVCYTIKKKTQTTFFGVYATFYYFLHSKVKIDTKTIDLLILKQNLSCCIRRFIFLGFALNYLFLKITQGYYWSYQGELTQCILLA
ncbi:transmembrane protein, putative (macronuclear) [Tetrahymena thermophila SB210]|uniref:Transmembrane protein, putative n=1 Tax=Tetrahymena thermophila (strain SB210) TaxID=312017 RepID=W7XDB0_TETTS|nr:transmembrane protein, putative [Tetrahymena thermophila SB210]EWS74623.1 transmembrane protein, putative [Tetrahymena thermophila SB210]|eukprot:XP_012652845.1 transmembrane protein, putative [Tetrahymena thermophila SB210]